MAFNLPKNGPPGSKKKFFLAIIVLFAVILVFALLKDKVTFVGGLPVFKKEKTEEPKKELSDVPFPVKTFKTARVNFRDTLPALGTIKGFREFDLKFAAQGYVEYINFKEGERITQGDIIASLDQKEQLLKLEYAKLEMDKNQKLYDLGSIIEVKLKQSQLEYQSAKADLDKTNLVAISDGYMGSIDVDKGSYLTSQDKLGTFVDIKDVYIEFGVIEKDMAKIREGQNVEVTFDTFPDQVFKGAIDSVAPMVEGRTRMMRIRSKITNIDEKVKPGMFGRVSVLVYEKDQALVIPSSSFKKKEDQYFVYLVHPDEPKEDQPEAQGAAADELQQPQKQGNLLSRLFGKKEAAPRKAPSLLDEPDVKLGSIEARTIEIAYATPDAIEVKEGLEDGDLVVMDVEQEFQDKARVEITETQEGIF